MLTQPQLSRLNRMKTARTLLAVLGTLLATLVLIVPAQAQQDRYEQLAHDLHTPGLAMVEFDTNGITDEHYVGVDGNNKNWQTKGSSILTPLSPSTTPSSETQPSAITVPPSPI